LRSKHVEAPEPAGGHRAARAAPGLHGRRPAAPGAERGGLQEPGGRAGDRRVGRALPLLAASSQTPRKPSK